MPVLGLSKEILPAVGTAWGTLMALSMLHVHGLLAEVISAAELCLGTKEVKCLLLDPVSLKRFQFCAEGC